MDIEIATHDIIPEWMDLAREVEPLFQAPMADDPEFRVYIEGKISKKEVIISRDKDNHNALMGGIVISHNNNRISWFAVSEMYKRKGLGSKLLDYALNELGKDKVIEVTTFQENMPDGVPARKLYKKFGFVDYDLTVTMNGNPRSLMKRFPQNGE